MAEARMQHPPTSLKPGELSLFQKLMLDYAGVALPASKSALVAGRLGKRLIAHNCNSFSDYHRLLSADQEERQKAVDLLTTNETYFFREPKHFDFLREQVLPAWSNSQRGGRTYRAWSAACSSGEEAYTLAMVLADHFGDTGWHVMGSDINREVVQKARIGHYGMARTEGIPRANLYRYCLKGKGRQERTFLIDRPLRRNVDFRVINLNGPSPAMEPFDLIMLRNVMIYFPRETKVKVVASLSRLLRRGGYLIIGHSESLHGIPCDLELVRPSIYRLAE